MDSLSSNSHVRNYDIPKSEEDLAEWTTRIKALQRQVDADDEAEQRRLEEEIAAARRARQRRSRGPEGMTSRDYSSNPSRSNYGQTNVEKQTYQTESSKRSVIAGYNGPGAAFDAEKKSFSQTSLTQPVKKAEPVSLAAFIGGRATGPRLTKHAPQQDATDPTQFEQRVHTAAPHPVFGRNGIAMPGLVGQRPSEVRNLEVSSAGGLPRSFIDSKSHAPLPEKRYIEQSVELPISSRRTGDKKSKENKENRVSQKTGERRVAFVPSEDNSSPLQKTSVREPVPFPSKVGEQEQTVPHQRTSSRERAISTPVGFTGMKGVVRPSSRDPERRDTLQVGIPLKDRFKQSTTSQSETTSRRASTVSPAPQKPPSTTSYLARPIQPQPRPLSQPAMASSYPVPSPAFAKPPAPKEVTPSISRLQGRGFVQSIVKISSQLEGSAATPPNPLPTKPRTGRKPSVLDRWQPQITASSSTPPLVAPKPVTLAKALPSNPLPFDKTRPSSASPVKQLRTRASLPSISQGITDGVKFEKNNSSLKKMPPDGAPGLGSATTMAIYKPSASPIESEFTHVDELGNRVQTGSPRTKDAGNAHSSGGLPLPSGKPLSHPTKDRARKPRKVKDVQGTGQERDKETAEERVQDRGSMTAPSKRSITMAFSGQQDARALNVTDILPEHPDNPPRAGRNSIPGNVASRWTEQTLITAFPGSLPITSQDETKQVIHLGRALPGMTSHPNTVEPTAVVSRPKSSSSISRNREGNVVGQPAHAAMRHAHSPSTGRRLTVMDVALALSQQADIPNSPEKTLRKQGGKDQNLAATQVIMHEMKRERRKSTLGHYSSIMLPAVKEEITPSSTPNNTLSRHTHPPNNVNVPNTKKSVETSTQPRTSCTDSTLPLVDVPQLLKSQAMLEFSNPTIQAISVDVLSVTSLTTTTILQNSNIFYDTELLAIVYRSKSKVDGLVSTTLWVWRGTHSQVGDKEQRKIQDLAKHYGTNAILVKQCSEPPKLVYLLGGILAIRQGSRSRWSSENTTMHLIREKGGVIFIDEFDLAAKNLCSAFSYCISILNTIYVWYGRGSIQAERQAALQYARSCSLESQQPVELREGEDDIDEMFWMLLGGQDYAKADYWKWRKEAPATDPVIWRVRAEPGDQPVTPISSLASESNFQEGIYILNCVWEFFVLVGSQARSRKLDIRLSLDVAQTMSKTLAPHRPFLPTVHVLVLPSQLPLDMRLNFRDLDEEILNNGVVPEHMNILSLAEASNSLQNGHMMLAN